MIRMHNIYIPEVVLLSQGQRSEPTTSNPFHGFGFGGQNGGFQMSFGIGQFQYLPS